MRSELSNGLTVKVDKIRLLERLKENRTAHAEQFSLAHEGWRDAVREELSGKLARLEADQWSDDDDRWLKNQEPDDHTSDYDDVIGMLELCQDTEIPLTHGQYTQFIKDEWGWKSSWIGSNDAYVTSASLKVGK